MTQFYTVKQIDNSRLVRPAAPKVFRDYFRMVALGAVVAVGGLLYAWQHFHCILLGYQLEELKLERGQAAELSSQLRLEAASLRSPMRIESIARQELGLAAPLPGQVGPIAGAPAEILAAAGPLPEPASQ
jgi:cell division protein FtsL